jgi:hypothetical protein
MTEKSPVIRDTRSDMSPPGASGDSPIVESVHIADPQRRDLLRSLNGRSLTSLEDIAAQLVAWRSGTDPEEVSAMRRREVQRRLLETHIPRLRACGLVAYDESTDTVSLTDCGESIVSEDQPLH